MCRIGLLPDHMEGLFVDALLVGLDLDELAVLDGHRVLRLQIVNHILIETLVAHI